MHNRKTKDIGYPTKPQNTCNAQHKTCNKHSNDADLHLNVTLMPACMCETSLDLTNYNTL